MANLVSLLVLLGTAAAAWAGLGWLTLHVPPARPFALVVVYVFAFTATTGTAALTAWVAVRPRLEDGRLASPLSYLGHTMLLGVIALFGLWLQSLRMLTPMVAVLLVGLYGLLELAILFGTRGSVELPVEGHASALR
jgi:hypothetical protein